MKIDTVKMARATAQKRWSIREFKKYFKAQNEIAKPRKGDMFMAELSEHIQTADWKTEKHVPAIECPETVKAGEIFQVKVSLGKEVAHPNTTEHHIRWISLYYHDKGGKFPHQVVHTEFTAHGESTDGPNKGPAYAHHEVVASIKIAKPGMLHAMAYCNIHGLWESSKEIKVE